MSERRMFSGLQKTARNHRAAAMALSLFRSAWHMLGAQHCLATLGRDEARAVCLANTGHARWEEAGHSLLSRDRQVRGGEVPARF